MMQQTTEATSSFQPSFWLVRYAWLVSFATFILLLAGGLVTSHEAGLAVPDWPRSYGQWMPPMVGNIFWEHGHRMIAGTVGIMTLLLTLWVQFQEKRTWLKQLAWIAFASVIVQAVLGGITVLFMLPAPISISHACLGQTFFCLILVITYFLSYDWKPLEVEYKEEQWLRRVFLPTTLIIYLQLILGATVRHTGSLIVIHIINAFVVLFMILRSVLLVSSITSPHKGFERTTKVWGFLVVVQFFLGMGAFIFTQMLRSGYAPSDLEVFFASFHQTLGAVILGMGVLLTVRVYQK